MARFRHIQNSFSSGELSPKMRGRTDVQEYFSGAETLENVVVMKEGGSFQRPGFLFINNCFKTGGPFPADTPTDEIAAFPLADSNYFVVFKFKSGGTVADPVAWIVDVRGLTQNAASGTGSIKLGSVLLSVTDDSAKPYNTSLSARDLRTVRFGNIDIFYHTGGTMSPLILGILDNVNAPYSYDLSCWGRSLVSTRDRVDRITPYMYPYEAINIDQNKAIRNLVEINAIGVTHADGFEFYNSTPASINMDPYIEVGTIIRVDNSTTSVYFGIVTALNGGNNKFSMYMFYVLNVTPINTDVKSWYFGAWSPNRGYPKAASVSNGRLCFMNNLKFPTRMWFSTPSSFLQFMQPRFASANAADLGAPTYGPSTDQNALLADPFDADVSSQETSALLWGLPGQYMEIGGNKNEFSFKPINGVLSFINKNISEDDSKGSANIQAVRIDGSVVFIGEDRRTTFQRNTSEEGSRSVSADISVLNDHLTDYGAATATIGTIRKIVASRFGMLWFLTASGRLYGLTFNKSAKVYGGHKHALGGGDTYAILDIFIAPLETFNRDTLWALVKRVISGTSYYTIERMASFFLGDTLGVAYADDDDCAVYLDSCIVIRNSPAATSMTVATASPTIINSLFTDKTVHVVADGVYLGTKTLSTNTLTLTTAASLVLVGFSYEAVWKDMPIEAGSQIGSSQEAIKRIHRAEVKFYKSKAAKIGSATENMEVIPFLNNTTLETIAKVVDFPSSPDSSQQVIIKNNKPLPCNILAITKKGELHD